MKGWSLHACWNDPICRTNGAASRLHIGTPVGMLTLAFRRDDWMQMWLPWKTRNPLLPIEKFPDQKSHYTRWCSPICWDPRRDVKVSTLLLEGLDTLGHWVGWCPAWLCDRHDRDITGEPPRRKKRS